ncbi:Zinc finger C2H2-type [Sesbania bispinosa]|nr:Zinc finger C2H2-type [Sesbania bispinosa]
MLMFNYQLYLCKSSITIGSPISIEAFVLTITSYLFERIQQSLALSSVVSCRRDCWLLLILSASNGNGDDDGGEEVVWFVVEQRTPFLMVSVLKFRTIFYTLEATSRQIYGALRYFHSGSEWVHKGLDKNLNLAPNEKQKRVGLFWDLDNKPPNSIPPYEVANKLRIAASSFGVVRYMVAYANSHTFSHVPQVVKERRKERALLNRLENKGVIKPNEPYLCRVCGRKFYTNEKLVNHFKQLHEREHIKRMNQIESAKGNRKVKLVAKYSMKMEKYKKAANAVLTPKVGYGLADELKRAGFWVQTVLDKPQAADRALQNHMVDIMDHRRVECLVLVSDDSDFVDVIKEAKLRCLKTVVIGDTTDDGVLKRTADAAFSWEEILMGKAKKEAVSVVENWKDRDILKRLEWTYNPEVDKKKFNLNDKVTETSEDEDMEDICDEVDDDYKDDRGSWWELDYDNVTTRGKLSIVSVSR